MLLWGMIALYAAARVLQLFSASVPMLAIVILHVIPPAVFVLVFGARVYGWRGIAVFAVLCVGVGGIAEVVGVHTGFPFGRYYFTGLMGPKFFDVPFLLALAYLGMGYLSWIIARLIVGRAAPFVAALIMASWDLAMDPIWSTVMHAWVWVDGGPWFGVPLSNYFGWMLTACIYYGLFALYLRGRVERKQTRGHWRQAVVFYAVSAAGNLLLLIPRPVNVIAAVCALVTVFTMGAFAIIAWTRT
jgi:putative membrane protein